MSRLDDDGEVIADWAGAGEHMGAAYLRYSFTKGTEQEVAFLLDALRLEPGMRVLDVGCGPGRHAAALARHGVDVVGVDLSPRFVEVAVEHAGPRFAVGDARDLPVRPASFDAAISLCQGGFGLVGDDDGTVLDEIRRALKPGGRAALTAFSAYFQVRHLEDGDEFDAGAGANTEVTFVKGEDGADRPFRMRATVFTPRELRLLCAGAGLAVEHLWSVSPGRYHAAPPSLETPEYLVVAVR
ncbi:MAG TPA: methyltransferase domain-containing protein [Acidimicrobiales bacterium]|nr:methyltransferase domain-containing protein [Acidimicrobiales bacterium]